MSASTRKATHAGSWYTSSGTKLEQELQANLDKVTPLPELDYSPPVQNAKAIIAPHAGYSYSGPAAAWAYAAVPTDQIKRVILIGPSHHAYIPGVAISPFKSYGTPLGDIPLDLDVIKELDATGHFEHVKGSVDEDEHSLEMHLPYIRHIFKGRDDLKLVPLIVGHPSGNNSEKVVSALEKYWKDSETFFIISSDFCHWGSRFRCTPYYPNVPSLAKPVPPVPQRSRPASSDPPELVRTFKKASPEVPIWQSIEYMDHEGIDLLRQPASKGALEKWEAYLSSTKNTICGRGPISLLVQLIQFVHAEQEGPKPEFVFVRYEQSSQCVSGDDSSVSYVSGVLRTP